MKYLTKYIDKLFLALRFKKRRIPVSPFLLLKKLQESQYWERDQLQKYQLKKLNGLIQEAQNGTIYYKNKINGNDSIYKDLKSFSENFPQLSKNKIVENSKDLLNDQLANRFKHSTSGSTGQPLTIELSGLAEAYRFAAKMRFYNWWGVDFYDKSVLIWKINRSNENPLSLSEKFSNKIKNRLDVDIFNLNDKTIYTYVDQIDNFNPKIIRSYKSGLYEFARLMEKHNLQFKKAKLKVAIVTSEILLENEREYIESVLKCKVANEYGAAEGGFYACECPEGSMHINEETNFIATDINNNAFVTELFNNSMPLINYKNDDKIVISNDYCTCGRTSRLISSIEGRTGDYILCPDGTKKNSFILAYIIRESVEDGFKGSVKQYRIIQNKNKFLLEFIAGKNYNTKVSEIIKKRMYKEIGKEIEIEIKLVPQIQREKSGKLRIFIRES